MTTLVERLIELREKATPGPWDVYRHPIHEADDAKRELCEQVEHTAPLSGYLFLLNAGGKCPGTTGCGPTSEANARLLIELVNNLDTIIAALSEGEMVRVPREPTKEMLEALRSGMSHDGFDFVFDERKAYRAMISASPSVKEHGNVE